MAFWTPALVIIGGGPGQTDRMMHPDCPFLFQSEQQCWDWINLNEPKTRWFPTSLKEFA